MPIPGITGFHFVQPSENGHTAKRYSSKVVTQDVEEEINTENTLDINIETNETDTHTLTSNQRKLVCFFLGEITVLVYWTCFRNSKQKSGKSRLPVTNQELL